MSRVTLLFFSVVCAVLLCSAVSKSISHSRLKRSGSDQRLAELKALMGLSRGTGNHGQVDAGALGKRKRSEDFEDASTYYQDAIRLRLVEDLLDNILGNSQS